MKVAYVANTIIPLIASAENLELSCGAGWISEIIDTLSKNKKNSIVYIFPYPTQIEGEIGNLHYCSFPIFSPLKYSDKVENILYEMINVQNPDIIHIFGTEYPHSLAAFRAAKRLNMTSKIVIYIQGLVSYCSKHYLADLPYKTFFHATLHDIVKNDTIIAQKHKFSIRGKFEEELLCESENVIGRTEWDEACVKSINPEVRYFKCNEILREPFYCGTWSYNNCKKHSIFVTQCNYPLKGFHKMLMAFSLILKKYPDAELYTTGRDLSLKQEIIHKTYYWEYIRKMIKKLGLKGKIHFLGDLSGAAIKAAMLKANVFVLPSSIENSSNSLGEAMLLGMPCVVADVGGITSMIDHNEEGFVYPFEEEYMIAHYVDRIFTDHELSSRLSYAAQRRARVTHDVQTNSHQLLKIYSEVAKDTCIE